MDLVQCRIVTDDVAGLAGFYATLLGAPAALNEYYVEIAAGPASVGFSRRRFTEAEAPACGRGSGPRAAGGCASGGSGGRASGARASGRRDGIILDFVVEDVDAEYARIASLGVDWVMPPATQPWGNRSMIFRDPAGNLVNVFSRGA
jgi:catechol 2,3-dioxygenase-like lactoylglutathione lyase family enzyme